MTVQPEYFGGTPTSQTGYRKPSKSILQSILDDAKQSPIYRAGEIAVRGAGEAINMLTDATSFQAGVAGFSAGEQARARGASSEQVTQIQEEVKEKAQQSQLEANYGLGLGPVGIALGAGERAWSYGVSRPASTVALVTDPSSPLYTGETFSNQGEDIELKPGFQLDDIRNAWNRSEQVSFGQAAVANPLASMTPGVGYLYSLGGVNSYDPWSEYDMSQAQDNPYYRFVTGSADLGLAIAVPPVAKIGRLKALDRVGLRTTVKSADDIAIMRSDYDYHRTWLASEGKEGHKTTFGEWIDVITEETNPVRLRQYAPVANANGVDKFTLSGILAKTSDRDTVANILLANNGDFRALRDLAERSPDDVWALSDMNSVLRDGYINGTDFMPEGDALIRTNQIFDSALNRDDYFRSLRNLFTTANEAEFKIRGPGSTWMPSKSMTVERIRLGKNKFTYAARTGDYSDSPKWAQQVAQSTPGGPVTVFLQWAGSRQPLGHVSKSGARPDDIWDELTAHFDSVPPLRGNRPIVVGTENVDGEVVPFTLPASTYRNQMMAELSEASASGNIMAAWRQMEDNIVDNMANSLGVNVELARRFAAGYRQKADDSVAYMRESGGYVFDEKGSRVWIDPVSQRQMLNSFPTLPLDEIYNGLRDEISLLSKYGGGAQELTIDAFDAGMKFFRTNVLFRPGYTGKNSISEPLLASWLAHGTILTDEGLTATLGNFVSNRANMGKRAAYMMELDTVFKKRAKGEVPKTRKQLRNELRELARQRNDVEGVIDDILIELDNLKAGRLSVARAREVEPELRERLVDAQLRLEKIEAALDGQAPEWRQIVEPARLSTIREKLQDYRRILESDQEIPDRDSVVAMVDDLQEQYDDLIARKDTDFSDPAREIEKLQKNLAIIDSKTAAAQVALGAKREAIGEVSGMRGYRGSGQGYMEVQVGGEKISVPAAFSDREFDFGSGYRAEASVATTNRLTYDPSYRAEYEMSRWQRTGQITEIRPNDPAYWDELAHVANRYFRDDRLIQRILRGDSRAEVGAWLRSNEGISYQKSMGKSYLVPKEKYQKPVTAIPEIDPSTAQVPERSVLDRVLNAKPKTGKRVILESTTELDEIYRLVDQYFPDREIRGTIAAREVTPGELQRKMGSLPNLSRITGEDLLYVPGSRAAVAYRGMNRFLDRVWQFIATMPEDRVARWPFYQREFQHQMQRRTDILSRQGVKMDEKQLAAMRQASHREALNELEKTFYNIRRYNTPVYMSRFLLSFPGAFFNSLYRYGRFAVKEPERLFQTGLFASDILTNMGVDAEGNPVENPEDAVYLLIPGTKNSMTDTGLRIPVASFASLTVNAPALSYLATVSVAELTKRNPKTEEILQQSLGPAYQEVFPYGIPDNPLSGFFGSYQKDFWRAGRGESDEDFIRASVQIYADEVAKWEKNGAQGEAPTFDEAADKAGDFYRSRGGLKFLNAFTVNQRVPGQMMRDAWYKIRNQYPGNTQEARKVFLEQYGDWARWYTYSSSQYEAYIPNTQDAYDRIWVDYPELTKDIVSIAQDDMDLVSLMAIGTRGDYSPAVGNYMRSNPLPGDDRPVISRMPVAQFDNMVKRNDGWAIYTRERTKYDAEVARLREMRDTATTEESKDYARSLIKANQESWRQWVTDYSNYNEAWGVDFNTPSARSSKNAAIVLRKMLGNKKFAKTDGGKPLWRNVKTFLDSREKALESVRNESDSERKKQQKESFNTWVTETLLVESPEFTEAWQRFFAREWTVE